MIDPGRKQPKRTSVMVAPMPLMSEILTPKELTSSIYIYVDRKLKLSDGRRKNINNVVEFQCKDEEVYQKCYRSVEKV